MANILVLIICFASHIVEGSFDVHQNDAITYGLNVALLVISSPEKVSFRAAWRSWLVPQLNMYNIDVWFMVQTNTTAVIKEAEQYKDIVFLSGRKEVFGDSLSAFRRRTLESIQWALGHTRQYGWIIRADDDMFWCGRLLRQEVNRFDEEFSEKMIHWGHYEEIIFHNTLMNASDCTSVYNRAAAEMHVKMTLEQLQANNNRKPVEGPAEWLYMDYVDKNPETIVIRDSRFAYGDRGPSTHRVDLKGGWVSWAHMTRDQKECYCMTHVSLHLNIKKTVVRAIKDLAHFQVIETGTKTVDGGL